MGVTCLLFLLTGFTFNLFVHCGSPKIGECSCGFNGTSGNITSPPFTDVMCQYNITVPEGYVVILTFIYFNVNEVDEHEADIVRVYSDLGLNNFISGYSGYIPRDFQVVSHSNEMSVTFFNDINGEHNGNDNGNENELAGFKARFTSVLASSLHPDPCNGSGLYLSNPDFIQSPGYRSNGGGRYGNNLDCSWIISSLCQMTINVVDFELEELRLDIFPTDIMRVYDGATRSDPLLGEYVDELDPFTIPPATGSTVLITLNTDYYIELNGFRIIFSYSECATTTPGTTQETTILDTSETTVLDTTILDTTVGLLDTTVLDKMVLDTTVLETTTMVPERTTPLETMDTTSLDPIDGNTSQTNLTPSSPDIPTNTAHYTPNSENTTESPEQPPMCNTSSTTCNNDTLNLPTAENNEVF